MARDIEGAKALVTGANRGIGLAVCRGLAARGASVAMAVRDREKGEQARQSLLNLPGEVTLHVCDVTDEAAIARLTHNLAVQWKELHILINNAGISNRYRDRTWEVGADDFDQVMSTNVRGPFLMIKYCMPLMRNAQWARIVNTSSGMGSIADGMVGRASAYRISKAALNAMTRNLAAEVDGSKILVNAYCPGWVATEMGGSGASLTPAEGADTAIWLAMLDDGEYHGMFFREREPAEW